MREQLENVAERAGLDKVVDKEELRRKKENTNWTAVVIFGTCLVLIVQAVVQEFVI